nr:MULTISPECIES: helix-turn-helix domain-containing protein [Christiangramia]
MNAEFHIKNMVCRSCATVIKNALENKKIKVIEIELGRLVIETDKVSVIKEQLTEILRANDFDIIDTPEDKLVEQIKVKLIDLVNSIPARLETKLSVYLQKKLHQDYTTISKIFSYNQQITIEKYYIKLKVEKVKELIHSQEHNFTEISQMLGYSSLGHLSTQFKTETGMSLSQYKEVGAEIRSSLNRIL